MNKKGILLLILLNVLLLVSNPVVSQQYKKFGTVTLVSESATELRLKVIAYGSKKKNVALSAQANAFRAIFFNGIDGFNNASPLIDDKAKQEQDSYLQQFFDEQSYQAYIGNFSVVNEPQKSGKKEFKGAYNISILLKPLYRNLENYGLISGVANVNSIGKSIPITNQIETDRVSLPTIMVVPYAGQDANYADILNNNFLMRSAVAVVQEGFNKEGVSTIDLEARLNASSRSTAFDANSQTSLQKLLIQNSGSDVYVVTDFVKEYLSSGNQVTLILKAYETASGKILASIKGSSGRFRTDNFDKLCEIALSKILTDFFDQIITSINKTEKEGKTIVLTFSLSEDATINFDYIDEGTGVPLSDLFRAWLKNNAKNRYYHLQGATENTLIFDQIAIPTKDDFGNPYSKADFAFDLWNYIYNDLKIKCTKKVDGQNIYIVIN